jgi:hypothetical protein
VIGLFPAQVALAFLLIVVAACLAYSLCRPNKSATADSDVIKPAAAGRIIPMKMAALVAQEGVQLQVPTAALVEVAVVPHGGVEGVLAKP